MRVPEAVRGAPGRALLLSVLLLVVAVVGMRRVGWEMVLVPIPLLLLPLLGRRIFTNPVFVFAAFLTVSVNLDYFAFGDVLTADIITSAFLFYALMIRIGLQGRIWVENKVERIYVFYLVATLPSVILSLEIGSSIKNWGRDVEYLILLHFIGGLALTNRSRRMLVGATILSSVIPCLLGIYGMMYNVPDFYGSEAPVGGGELVSRVSSTLAHPGMFSQYLCTVGVLTLAMILDGRWFRRSLLVPLFLVQITMLYFTYTRAMWLEFVVGVTALLWLLGHRRFVLAGIPAGLIGIAIAIPSFIARWETAWDMNSENSMIWRLALWAKALSLYPNHPFFGSGQDTFIDYVNFLGFGAHNTWLKFLVETGAIGLVAGVILVVVVTKALWGKVKELGRSDPLATAVFAIWIGTLVASWVSDTLEVPPVNLYLWTLVGLVICWPQARPASEAQPSPAGEGSPRG